MSEQTYTLILDSQNSTNLISNTNIYACQYYINWDAILEPKYQTYSLTYTLKSVNSTQQTTTFTATTSSITFSGFILGTILTVTASSANSIAVGNDFSLNNITYQIVNQIGGTAGGAGTYTVNTPVVANTFTALFSGNQMFEETVPLIPLNVGNSLWLNGTLSTITAYNWLTGGYTLSTNGSNGTATKTFVASIAGQTLTVTSVTLGNLAVGDYFLVGGLPNQIEAQLGGTAGGAGTYQILIGSVTVSATYNVYAPVNCATYTLSTNIAIDIMTVTAVASGTLTIGQQFYTGNVLNQIVALGTGTGGNGTYYLSQPSTIGTATSFIALPTTLTQNLFVDINFGKSYVYEQSNSMSTKIGICYPVIEQQYNTVLSYYYSSNLNDNLPVCIGYPTNKTITVNLYQYDNVSLPTLFQNYVILLKFTPIKNID